MPNKEFEGVSNEDLFKEYDLHADRDNMYMSLATIELIERFRDVVRVNKLKEADDKILQPEPKDVLIAKHVNVLPLASSEETWERIKEIEQRTLEAINSMIESQLIIALEERMLTIDHIKDGRVKLYLQTFPFTLGEKRVEQYSLSTNTKDLPLIVVTYENGGATIQRPTGQE